MKLRHVLGAFLAGCACTVLAASALTPTQDQDPADVEKAFMEAIEKYGTPGPEHERLARRVGTWNVEGRFWFAADAEPETHTAVARFTPILNGRYVMQEYRSEYGGQPFEGRGIMGFDRMKSKYVSIWMDNMGTAISHAQGAAQGDTLELRGEMPDLMAGKYTKTREVIKHISDDRFIMEMHQPGADGASFKSMELIYTRAVE